ncbi:MAG: NAD(P)-dependent alcohol dehydrogenase [Dehalococcoidia bacterium]|nr:NAD(P)-dependent alcohol dehydrogenase [Dehalococcoidia bacterium]
MKAYRLTAGGGIDGLQLLDLPEPEPAADEVVVAVRATSLNYRDLMLARSNPEAIIPLSDGAGDVIAVGSRVTGVAVGDRVAGCFFPEWIDGAPRIEGIRVALGGASTDGMLAERVVLRAQGVVKLPASLTYEEAATLPCSALTAWNSLFEQVEFRPGHSVLLLGTGGVSIAGLQLAHAAGMHTVITSSSNEKLEQARALGASATINYREREDWDRAVREATAGRGVDQVLEVGGEGTWVQSMAAARTGGHIALIGGVSQDRPAAGVPLVGRGLRATRITVGSRRMFEDMLRAMEVSEIHPVIDRVFDFDQAPEAYRYLESQAHVGKIVIRV